MTDERKEHWSGLQENASTLLESQQSNGVTRSKLTSITCIRRWQRKNIEKMDTGIATKDSRTFCTHTDALLSLSTFSKYTPEFVCYH
ncbi:hypothetical protein KIN20_003542 [Parelaphostrongylus tenuis]|uniref:Uncharacterized protein n=1 Tax=Parelaphostrongylus tenuis TaxID=148309 RepID=A0AAD5QG46_PARTN|nr:hypothetical protein KIN20_003542 [Parelaphostrongylus tenuis]